MFSRCYRFGGSSAGPKEGAQKGPMGPKGRGPKEGRGPKGPKGRGPKEGTIFIDGFPLIFIDGSAAMPLGTSGRV